MLKRAFLGFLASAALLAPLSADAALASVSADLKGDGTKYLVELDGERLGAESSYFGKLMVFVRDQEGKLVGAWKPDIEGGYNFILEKIPAPEEKKEEAKKDPSLKETIEEAFEKYDEKVEEKAAEKAAEEAAEKAAEKAAEEPSAPDLTETGGQMRYDASGAPAQGAISPTPLQKEERSSTSLLNERKHEGSEKITAKKAASRKKAEADEKKGRDDILLMVSVGGSDETAECRVVDFADPKKAREIFSGADSLGIAASARFKEGFFYEVECSYVPAAADLTGEEPVERVEDVLRGIAPNDMAIFDEKGAVKKPYLRPTVTPVTAMTGQFGCLFTRQNILGPDMRRLLGTILTRWVYKDGRWRPAEVRLEDKVLDIEGMVSPADKAARAGRWQLYPRVAWIGSRVISRPSVAINDNPEAQARINETLDKCFAEGAPEEERAFQVNFAGPNLLSIECGRRDKLDRVVRHQFNFDMRTGADLSIADAFRAKDPDFIKVLNIAGDVKDGFTNGVKPHFWSYNGKFFVFKDRILTEDFQDESKIVRVMVEAGDLKKRLVKDPDLIRTVADEKKEKAEKSDTSKKADEKKEESR